MADPVTFYRVIIIMPNGDEQTFTEYVRQQNLELEKQTARNHFSEAVEVKHEPHDS